MLELSLAVDWSCALHGVLIALMCFYPKGEASLVGALVQEVSTLDALAAPC